MSYIKRNSAFYDGGLERNDLRGFIQRSPPALEQFGGIAGMIKLLDPRS
jgi:hypothetical protein